MRPLAHPLRAGLAAGLAAAVALGAGGCAPQSVLPEPEPAADGGWTLVNPRPFDVAITALWGTAPDRMFAVGLGGRVLVCEAGTWREAPSPTTTNLWDIHGCDWEHVWAVSDEGLLFFDGRRWRREGPAGLDSRARVRCNAPDDVMVVAPDETVSARFHHFDGAAWATGELPVEPAFWASDWLAGGPGGRFAAVGRDGRAALWENGAWLGVQPRFDFDLVAVAFQDRENGERWYAAGYDAGGDVIRIAYIYGTAWHSYDWLPGRRVVAMDAAPGTRYPYVLTRAAGGDTVALWGADLIGLVFPHYASMALARFPAGSLGLVEDLVLGGPWGTLLMLDHQGFAVRPLTQSLPLTPQEIEAWPDGSFAAREGNRIVEGRGTVLQEREVPAAPAISALWGPGPDDLFAAAAGGTVIRLRDGLPAEFQPTGSARDLLAVWGAGPADVWVGGWDASAHWDGTAWTPAPWPLAGALIRLAGGGGRVYAASDQALGRWDGAAWVDAGPAGAGQVHGLAADPEGGDPVVVVRLGDGGPRRVMRLAAGAWVDLGTPGDRAREPLVLPGGEVRVMTDQGWYRLADGRWQAVALPAVPAAAYQTAPLVGGPAAGFFVAYSTGGFYHLVPGEATAWR